MEESSKVPSVRKVRAKPELVMIGNRYVCSSGRWSDQLMADYVMLHGKLRWITIGELAKVAWGQNNITNKARARRYLSRLFHLLLVDKGHLMVVEYGAPDEHHRAKTVKMYDHDSEQDRQHLDAKLGRLKHSQELSTEQYDKALAILYARPSAPEESAVA